MQGRTSLITNPLSAVFPWILLCTCLLLLSTAPYSRAEAVLITRPDSGIIVVSPQQLRRLWLGERASLGEITVEIIDLDEAHPLREQFYLEFIGYKNRQLKSHWARRVFRGEGFPPRMLASEQAVVEWVSEASHRLGYIDSANLSEVVKRITVRE